MQNTPQDPSVRSTPQDPSALSPDDPTRPKGSAGAGCAVFLWGAGILAFALFLYFRAKGFDPDAAPTCGDDVMTPTDRCMGSPGGTYEDMQANALDNHEKDVLIGNIGIAAGGFFILLATFIWIRGSLRLRNRRNEREGQGQGQGQF